MVHFYCKEAPAGELPSGLWPMMMVGWRLALFRFYCSGIETFWLGSDMQICRRTMCLGRKKACQILVLESAVYVSHPVALQEQISWSVAIPMAYMDIPYSAIICLQISVGRWQCEVQVASVIEYWGGRRHHTTSNRWRIMEKYILKCSPVKNSVQMEYLHSQWRDREWVFLPAHTCTGFSKV